MNAKVASNTISGDAYFRASFVAVITAVFRAFNTNKASWVGLALFLAVVALAVLAPYISPHDPLEQNILDRLKGPSSVYWLGTDAFGRDIFSRIIWGARISLAIALFSIGVAMVLGTIISLVSGYVGGRFDIIVMQVMDVVMPSWHLSSISVSGTLSICVTTTKAGAQPYCCKTSMPISEDT